VAEQLQQSPQPTSEALPHEEYMKEGRLQIVIAGLDQNIRSQAFEIADNRLKEEIGQKGGFGTWIKNKVWKGGLLRNPYLARYRHDAQKQITESGNLYYHEEGVDAQSYARGTTLRLMHDFTNEELGESRRQITTVNEDGSTNEKDHQLKRGVFQLVEQFASGELDEQNFEEAKKRFFKDMVEQGLDQGQLGEGLLTTDNLLQIAQNVKTMVAHRQATGQGGIDEIWKDTDVIIGTANVGARTEIYQSLSDRLAQKMEKSGLSNWADEAVVGTAAVTALAVGGVVLKKPLMYVSAGAAAGAFAGARTNKMIKQARTLDARAAAVGKGRLEMFDQSRYEAAPATELVQKIGALYDEEGKLQLGSQEAYEYAMNLIAEADVRRSLSDSEKIDLISFSNLKNIEQERFDLDLALAKAKSDMRQHMSETGNEDAFETAFAGYFEAQAGVLDSEMIQQKDRIFRKMKRGKVAKAAVIGTVLGMATAGVSTTIQEVGSLMSDSQVGMLEAEIHNNEFLRDHLGLPAHTMEGVELSGDTQTIALGEHTELKLPAELTVEQNTDNTMTITGPGGLEISGLAVTNTGQLTAESQDILQSAGISVGSESGVVPEVVEQQVQLDGKEFVQNHEDLTTEITRDTWYDNGTAGTAEGTELSLQTPERDGSGNIQIAVGNLDMTATSSAGEQMNLQDAAANGDLKIAITASGDTQANAFLFDVDTDGNAIIPYDHPAAASLFDENGEFQGAFMEGVIQNGVNSDGATSVDVFATGVGPDANDFTDTVSETQHHRVDSYSLDFTPVTDQATELQPTREPGLPAMAYYGRNIQPIARASANERAGGGAGSEARLVPLPEVEARRQMESLKIGQLFKSELNVHQGWLRSLGPPIGNTYIFARVDQSGKQLPGKPAFYFLTQQQVLERLRQGRLQHQ
jgi:hypothetical protein